MAVKLLGEGGQRVIQPLAKVNQSALNTLDPLQYSQVFVENLGFLSGIQTVDSADTIDTFSSSRSGWLWKVNRNKWEEDVSVFDTQRYDTDGNEVAIGFIDQNANLLFGVYNNQKTTVHRDLDSVFSDNITTQPYWGMGRGRNWQAWSTGLVNEQIDIVIFGDSYTQGNYYTKVFKDMLIAKGYTDGGSGWCGFGRWGTTAISINQSVDSTKLNCTYTIADWTSENSGISPDGCAINSSAINTTLTINVVENANSLKVLYHVRPSGGQFRWRLNGGSYTTVDTNNATESVGVLTINPAGAPATVDIEALTTGVRLFGCTSTNTTTRGLRVHKCGKSGGTAANFGTDPLFTSAITNLTPKVVSIMFGTNEQGSNITPSIYAANIENIITGVKGYYNVCDFVLMLPCKTSRELTGLFSNNQYGEALMKVAKNNYGAFVNHAQVFGEWSNDLVTAGFMHPDLVHPATKGGYLIAKTMFNVFV